MAAGEGRGATAAMSAGLAAGRVARKVEVRSLSSTREFDECVALQIAVWGYADGDVIPRRVFIVASHIGGQVFGALVEGELAGFAMALPGVREGEAYLHSHMLAVLPRYRDAAGAAAEAGATCGCSRARLREDGVDVRSA